LADLAKQLDPSARVFIAPRLRRKPARVFFRQHSIIQVLNLPEIDRERQTRERGYRSVKAFKRGSGRILQSGLRQIL